MQLTHTVSGTVKVQGTSFYSEQEAIDQAFNAGYRAFASAVCSKFDITIYSVMEHATNQVRSKSVTLDMERDMFTAELTIQFKLKIG